METTRRMQLSVRVLRFLYLALLAGLVTTTYFFNHTKGLIAYIGYSGDIHFVQEEILSSGANDNSLIGFVGLLFLVPLVIEFVRGESRPGALTIVVFYLSWVIQALALLGIEVGSIAHTVLNARNFCLLIWILCYSAVPLIFSRYAYFDQEHKRRNRLAILRDVVPLVVTVMLLILK